MKRLAAWLSIALSAWLGVVGVRGGAREESALYPPRADAIAFQHATDAHRQLSCDRCHRPRADRPDDLRASESDCASCHADRIDRTQISAERCGSCHRGFDPAHPRAPAPVALPPSRLRFDHAKHTNVSCTTCHSGGDGATSLPSMSTCLTCHAATKSKPLPCNGCHLALPSGRLRTQFDDAKLIPRSGYLGMAHDADFYVRHRWVAADQGAVCATCHVESECTACHDGRRKPRGIHPNDYLSLHAQDSQRNATRCNSCHDSPSFCLPCHARLGISEISAPDVHAPRRFHPAASLWIRGPVLHAREAQRSLSSCVSCHAERDCVQCHGAPGVGTGLHSPHPAGFDAQCGEALARNPRACTMCHRASDPAFRTCR
ncbi:MAG TPA: cytochrome c3 family protein [Polyangiales bacterium]|nr:cytochrome c3 family protein [Polyangiales bacterium]